MRYEECFENDITPIYNYFKSIGLDGQKADKLIDTRLELLPKQTLIEKIITLILNKLLPCCFPARNYNSKQVIDTIEIRTQNCGNRLSADVLERAEFVKAVLKRIAKKSDPHLETLAAINRFRELLPHSVHPNKKHYVQLVDTLYAKYVAGEPVDVQAELPDATKEVEAKGFLSWNDMARGPLQQIFRKLGPQDLAAVSRTCKRWHSMATSKPVWDSFRDKGFSQFMPLLPEVPLEANLWKVFNLQRITCQAIEANHAHPETTAELSVENGENARFVDSTDPDDIFVRDGHVVIFYNPHKLPWQRAEGVFTWNVITQLMQIGDRMYKIFYTQMGSGLWVIHNDDLIYEDTNLEVERVSQANNKLIVFHRSKLHIIDLIAKSKSTKFLANFNYFSRVHLNEMCVYANDRLNENGDTHTLIDLTKDELCSKTINLGHYGLKIFANTPAALFAADHHKLYAFDIETGKKLGIYKPQNAANGRYASAPTWKNPVVANSCSVHEYYEIVKVAIYEDLLISMNCRELHIFNLYSRKHVKTLLGFEITDFLVKKNSLFCIARERDLTNKAARYKVFEYNLRPVTD